MTGRLCDALISGVHTFTRRQSSPATVAAAPRCSTNASSSEFARFFPLVSKCAESRYGQIRPYCSALRIPVQGSGLTGGLKRLAPAVDAPQGTPLKMNTPFRLNPRIFPAERRIHFQGCTLRRVNRRRKALQAASQAGTLD